MIDGRLLCVLGLAWGTVACSDDQGTPHASGGGSAGNAAGSSSGASGLPGAGTSGQASAGNGAVGGSGGSAGMSTAGASGSAGAGGGAAGSGGVVPGTYPRGQSMGCGKALPAGQQGGEPFRFDVPTTPSDAAWLEEFNADANEYEGRNYKVVVPVDYDPKKPYTVNIIGGGCGGDGSGFGGLSAWRKEDDTQIIFVNPAYKGGCYEDDGVNNPEISFWKVWWPEFKANYCVDQERVFATGYSSGSWMAYTDACAFSGDVRGIGPTSGGLRERRGPCVGPVAAIIGADLSDNANPIHDTEDDVTCTGTEAEGCWLGHKICTGTHKDDKNDCVDEGTAVARDELLKRNGCVGTETVPWGGTISDMPIEQGGLYRYTTFLKVKPGEAVAQDSLDKFKAYFPVPADGKNTMPACHKYVGCPAEFPVVWCMTYDDGHSPESRISEQEGDDGRTGYQRFFEDDVPRYQ